MCCKRFTFSRFLPLTALMLFGAGPAVAQVADYENLTLEPESYWNGSDRLVEGHYEPGHWMGAATFYHGGFNSGGADFSNTFIEWWQPDGTLWYTSWGGWAYSNVTDTTTPGFGNQYSAYAPTAGGGHGGSANYAVYYDGYEAPQPTLAGIAPGTLLGAYFTNTTYTALSMRDGDGWSFPFEEGDWFLLTITGLDDGGQETGMVEFHLADYTSSDETGWYIIDDWTWVDLSSLGSATQVQFALSSSDWDPIWGMSTPAYFAMDNLTLIPEPSALLLLLCSAAAGTALLGRRRRRRSQ